VLVQVAAVRFSQSMERTLLIPHSEGGDLAVGHRADNHAAARGLTVAVRLAEAAPVFRLYPCPPQTATPLRETSLQGSLYQVDRSKQR
jgi:hypothetical protein